MEPPMTALEQMDAILIEMSQISPDLSQDQKRRLVVKYVQRAYDLLVRELGETEAKAIMLRVTSANPIL